MFPAVLRPAVSRHRAAGKEIKQLFFELAGFPVSHKYGIWSRQAASSLRQERTPVMKPYSHTQSSARGW